MSISPLKLKKPSGEQPSGMHSGSDSTPKNSNVAKDAESEGGTGGNDNEIGVTDGEHNLHMCREMILVYAKKYLFLVTAFWVFVLILSGAVDLTAMFHVLSQKYLDAFGNPTTGTVTLILAAGMTLMWFMFISVLLQTSKIGAAAVWALLVLFLGVTLWPSEVSSLQSLWGTTQSQTGGFDAANSGAISSAPLWFLIIGISILAVGYTLPGLMFIYAKRKVGHINELWRLRAEACAVIAQADAIDAECEIGRVGGSVADHFNDVSILDSAATHCALEASHGYEKAITSQVNNAKARLASTNTITNQERKQAANIIKDGGSLLQKLASLSI